MKKRTSTITVSWRLVPLVLIAVVSLAGGCGNSKAAEKGHKEHGKDSHGKGSHDKGSHDKGSHDKGSHDKDSQGKDDHSEHDRSVRLSPSQLKEFDIELRTAGSGTLTIRHNLTGEVRLNPGRVAHLVPSIAGVTRKVHKQLGAPVRKGELMATLASRELAQLNGSYLAAQANASLAWIEYKREKSLYKRGVSSQREY